MLPFWRPALLWWCSYEQFRLWEALEVSDRPIPPRPATAPAPRYPPRLTCCCSVCFYGPGPQSGCIPVIGAGHPMPAILGADHPLPTLRSCHTTISEVWWT